MKTQTKGVCSAIYGQKKKKKKKLRKINTQPDGVQIMRALTHRVDGGMLMSVGQ